MPNIINPNPKFKKMVKDASIDLFIVTLLFMIYTLVLLSGMVGDIKYLP
jgi:hypothetical protein